MHSWFVDQYVQESHEELTEVSPNDMIQIKEFWFSTQSKPIHTQLD